NPLRGGGAAALAGCAALVGLRELNLAETALAPADVIALARSPHLRGLEVLVLGSDELGPEGFAALATGTDGGRGSSKAAIDPFPNLRVLSVQNAKPTLAGIEALARSALLSRLEMLDLSSNPLTKLAARRLADAAGIAGLRHLGLYNCGL